MKLESTAPIAEPQARPAQTPLVVQAIGAGVGLALVILIVGLLVLDMEAEQVVNASALAFCLCILLASLNSLIPVIEALAEKVTGRDLNQSGAVGDRPDIRLVPIRGSAYTIGGVEPEDWRHFVRTMCSTGDWTQATWRGVRMPSGRRCDNEYWERVTGHLKVLGIIVNAGPRATGELAIDDPNVILEMLGVNSN